MFYECYSLISLDLSNFFTPLVETVEGMFGRCALITSLNLTGFKTGNIKSLEYIF